MTDIPQSRMSAEQVKSVALETGLSAAQVRDIVFLIGIDRASVIREAWIVKTAASL
jgi:hypothetical protein